MSSAKRNSDGSWGGTLTGISIASSDARRFSRGKDGAATLLPLSCVQLNSGGDGTCMNATRKGRDKPGAFIDATSKKLLQATCDAVRLGSEEIPVASDAPIHQRS